ncbi:MAG: restriction endonuclease subunit S, partial [Lentisphaerae bacterium]|nr:restriction endonuclease subunit S [Lentisphaerota bacterium]
MSKWNNIKLGDLNEFRSETINPVRYESQTFELYSVPAYEAGLPEIVRGCEIGSSKQRVQEGDVLLCKINPRINRVWHVIRHTDHSLIASSEWIVIRSNKAYPQYLLWCLRSKSFREKIVLNVTGIGGSLTRAQPKTVAQYEIPLPPVSKQWEIAATLDTVSEILRLRKAQLAELDNLVKSQFIEMFG